MEWVILWIIFAVGLDALVGERVQRQGAEAGRLQPRCSMLPAKPQDAQAGPIALHGMGAGGQDLLHQLGGGISGLLRPADQALGTPLHILPVVAGHVLQHRSVAALGEGAQVRGHSLAFL